MRERDERATEPLLAREEPGYGVAEARVTGRRPDGGAVTVLLRALPDRPIDLDTGRDAHGVCRASASTAIAGARARLDHAYLELAWPFGVRAIVLSGTRPDGTPVEERVTR
jgi:hypothetical protein